MMSLFSLFFFSVEYLGHIPKAPIGRRYASGRYEMSLRRMARFAILQTRADSPCQTIARFALEYSPAQYMREYQVPSLTRQLNPIFRVLPDEGQVAILDYERLMELFRDMQLLEQPWIPDVHSMLYFRARLQQYFARRCNVSPEKHGLARFLSFHCCDYPPSCT